MMEVMNEGPGASEVRNNLLDLQGNTEELGAEWHCGLFLSVS